MDVGAWLTGLGLAGCVEAFAANGVDATLLHDLTNEDLKDLGVSRLADRKRLLSAIEELSKPVEQTELQRSSKSPDGERRPVTVLFADLVGFTRLTSELGPEAIHALLNRYFEVVDTIIAAHGGVVDKHIGDNVMAVFGAPIAHDDDSLRAVRAALTIHEQLASAFRHDGVLLQAHIGIASGQVVASNTGSDEHREYTVTGDSVNLAARLQDRAKAGETLISDGLRRAVGERVDCTALGELEVKGISTPLRVWRVIAVRSAGATPRRATFVGRRAEIGQFSGILEACRQNGLGQALVVRGEAGIGKSRLVDQYVRAAIEQGFAAHRGLVLDFGSGEGRDAIRSVVANLLGLQLGSDEDSLAAAIATALREGVVSADQRPFLADLLNLVLSRDDRAIYDAMTNATRIEGKQAVVCSLLRYCSARQPLIILIEDIHWADGLVLKHLARMAQTVAECSALLIMTSRVEGYPLDQEWRAAMGGSSLTTVDLGPLRREDASVLAGSLMGSESKLMQDCIERAAGNPLFLEHLLRDLDEGAGASVPDTIQTLVLARIDRLSPTDKQAIVAASILGKRFALDALRYLTSNPGYACAELVRRSLVRPEADGFLFSHALVQEGVYNSILTSTRAELHRRAAAWYKTSDPSLHAEHLDRALDPLAAEAYRAAANARIDTFHYETAVKLVDRGIELAKDPSKKSEMYCIRGDALRHLGATRESIESFESALQFAQDDLCRCRAWIGMAASLRIADRQQDALRLLDLAEAAALKHELASDRVQIHYLRGNLYFPLGNIEGCLSEHQKALKFARQVGSREGEALALGGLGDAFYLQGRMRSACEQFRACVAVCQSHGYVRIEVANRHMVGWTSIQLLENESALEDARDVIGMAATVGHLRARLLGLMLAGFIETEAGNLDEAEACMQQSLELSRALGAGNFEGQALSQLAVVNAEAGRMDKARAFAQLSTEVARKVGLMFFGPRLLAINASLTEDRKAAELLLKEAESILDAGCVSHNHFYFAQTAIDRSLAAGEWAEAERYAGRLEAYTSAQPLPYADFLIARGRSLAAWGRGNRSKVNLAEISRLHRIAVEHRLMSLAKALDLN